MDDEKTGLPGLWEGSPPQGRVEECKVRSSPPRGSDEPLGLRGTAGPEQVTGKTVVKAAAGAPPRGPNGSIEP